MQSFPDAYRFSRNMGDCFTQIDNAVPPLLAWAIAVNLLRLLGFPSATNPLAVVATQPSPTYGNPSQEAV